MIVHINGWPGVGKNTIGKIVSQQLNARFIHNHVLHDVALACAGYGDADRWPLYEQVRSAAYDVLKRRPKTEIFVMTNALCTGEAKEIAAWSRVVELAIDRSAMLIPIVLTADVDELSKRVASAERLDSKLKDPSALRQMIQEHKLQVPAVTETQEFDIGKLSANDAAAAVVAYVNKISEECEPASTNHLEFK